MYDRWVMEQKDLNKIKRRELLELMLEQAKRIQELELEIKDLKSELDSKKIKIKESGSIAEAALKLNNIFEDAENAVNQYYENFKDNCKKIETSIKKEATLEKLLGVPNKDEYNLLLMHTPVYFNEYSNWGADLVLARSCSWRTCIYSVCRWSFLTR